MTDIAGVAQLVERHLAKVDVAGSNPVSRSFLFYRTVLMKVSTNVVKNENANALLEIEVDKSSVQKKYDEIASNYQKSAVIPGFRKGKAPVGMVKNKYKENIDKDLLKKLIQEAYIKAINDSKLSPYTVPKIEIVKFANNDVFKFKAEVELFPEVELGDYTNLEFSRITYKISKKDIDKELGKIQENLADFVLKEDKKSGENDIITADVTAYNEKNEKLDRYSAENHKFELNKKAIYDEFYKGLLGKKAGDTVEIIKEYNKEYHDKELAGKKVRFEIKIKEVREKKLPEINDEFAKDVGDYKNLDELKDVIEKQLKDIADKYIEAKLEDDILNDIIEKSKFKIPETLIQEEVKRIVKDIETDLLRKGQKLNDLLESGTINKDEFEKENRENAVNSLKAYMVLREVAKLNKVEVSDNEIDEEIEKLAKSYKQTPENLKKALKENDIANIKATIRNKKTMEFLKSHNNITEGKPLKYDDLIKELSGKK